MVADEQTQGQGRRGRRWVSPPGGNIYATIILRPGPWDIRSLGMVAPLAVCEAVDAVADVRSVIKWPNDLLIEGRKVGGVLIDTRLSGEEVDYALVGVGINVNFDPSQHEEIREMATSLASELGREVSREALLAAFLNRFERLYLAARSDESVYEAWKARLETLGRRVEVRLGDDIEEGIAEDVDAEGNLILRRDRRQHRRLGSGRRYLTALTLLFLLWFALYLRFHRRRVAGGARRYGQRHALLHERRQDVDRHRSRLP